MSDSLLLLRTGLLVFYAIVFLWQGSTAMRETKVIAPLMPFFAYGLLFNALAAFVYYQLAFTTLWFFLDVAFFLCHIWILAVIFSAIKNIQNKQA